MSTRPTNWHRVLAAALVSLGGSAPAFPWPWCVVVGVMAPAAAAVLVRPQRISRGFDVISRAIPGKSLDGDDKRINDHAAEMNKLLAQASQLSKRR